MPSLPLPQSAPLNVPQTLAQALALHKQGKLNDAAQLYLRILTARPDHLDALIVWAHRSFRMMMSSSA